MIRYELFEQLLGTFLAKRTMVTVFLAARGRSKGCLSIPVDTQENLQPIPFVPLINIRPPLRSLD